MHHSHTFKKNIKQEIVLPNVTETTVKWKISDFILGVVLLDKTIL